MKYSSSLYVLILLVVTSVNLNGKNVAAKGSLHLMPTMAMPTNKAKPTDWSFLPQTIAEIDGKKISRQVLIDFFNEQLKITSSPMQLTPQQVKTVAPQLITELLTQKLLTPLAATAGFKPTPELVENVLKAEYKKMSPAEQAWRTRQLAFEGTTLAKFIKKQAASKIIQNKLAINEWVKSKTKVMPPTPAEVKAFYFKNRDNNSINQLLELRMSGDPTGTIRASHILIKIKNDDKNKASDANDKLARAKAEEILAKLKQGENFESLARANSDCSSAQQGGVLGSFGRGAMVKEFETVAYKLKPGKISGVVKTKFGYHIIRRDPAAETKYFPYETVKDKIAKYILDRRIKSNNTQKRRISFLKTQLDKAKAAHKVKLFLQVGNL